jgi:hypothetical protein
MKNKLKSKTIAIIGLAMYVLGVILSSEDLHGKPRFSPILKLISDTGMLTAIIMAIVRLWKQTRFVALTLMLSTILFFILGVIQQIASSNSIVIFNLSKLIFLITFLWAIIMLFQKKDAKE